MTHSNSIIAISPLGTQWPTLDPFLFCAHHLDHYPAGGANLGPDASLKGRNIGSDFGQKDGWSMYHGDTVPGFPRHPHRGFETITISRRGLVDHADSMGAMARFGDGDVQWMTAGDGVVHSEMFPLLNSEATNTLEMFQIWLNLPAAQKKSDPYFTMFWDDKIPEVTLTDALGHTSQVRVVAGRFDSTQALAAPPSSWAAHEQADVAVWTIILEPNAALTLPPAQAQSNRVLYFFEGDTLEVNGQEIDAGHAVQVMPDATVELRAGDASVELVVLQGKPIGEPVVRHGPFVMNRPEEIRQAMVDYHQTGFGGWPHATDGPTHPREQPRFALHSDGRRETPSL